MLGRRTPELHMQWSRGVYRACAHDYRPDLTQFVREVFNLPCSDEQLAPSRRRSKRERR
jgi:hypothetical protein